MNVWERLGYALGRGRKDKTPQTAKGVAEQAHAETESSPGAISRLRSALGGEVWPKSAVNSQTSARVYMVVPSVYTVVNKKARMISSAPLKLYRKDTRSGVEIEHTTGIIAGLLKNPHPFLTPTRLIQEIVIWQDICGRAYVYLDHYQGKPFLSVLEPYNVHIVVDPETKVKAYVYMVSGADPVYLPFELVAEFDHMNPGDYYFGLSPVEPLSTDIEAERYTKRWYASQMKKGNVRAGAIQTDKSFDDEELLKLKAEYKNRKPDSSRVFMLPKGFTFIPFPESGTDNLTREVLNETFDTVALAYDMHPILFGHSNTPRPEPLVDVETFVWNTALIPQQNYIAEVLTKKFGAVAGANFFFRFDNSQIPALKRADMDNTRVNTAKASLGEITINEWRISEGKRPFTLQEDGAEMEEFGRLAYPVWEQLQARKATMLAASLAPVKDAEGNAKPGPGLNAADQTSPALPMPGSEGGRRDQSQNGEPQMIDQTGKRSFDDIFRDVVSKRASLLAKIDDLSRLTEDLED